MLLFVSFRAQRSRAEKSVFNRFLHFRPLRGPPVEMTKAQILITIGIGILQETLGPDRLTAIVQLSNYQGGEGGNELEWDKRIFQAFLPCFDSENAFF